MPASPSSTLSDRVRERNRHRSWLLRALLLPWLALILVRHLRDPDFQSLWAGLNLAVHEAGHLLFLALPQFWAAAGATLIQLALPTLVGLLFLRRRADFGAALALFWLSTTLVGIAIYAGDARAQALPLDSPLSGAPVHGSAFLLGELGLLERAQTVAAAFRAAGLLLMAASVGLGTWIVGVMATDGERLRRGARGPADGDPMAEEGARLRAWLEAQGALPEENAVRGEPPATSPTDAEDGPPAPDAEDGPADDTTPRSDSEAPGGDLLGELERRLEKESLTPEEARLLEYLRKDRPRDG